MAIRVLSFYDQEQTGPNVSQYGDCDAGLTVLDNGKGYAEAAKASAEAAKISETNAASSAASAQASAQAAQEAASSTKENAQDAINAAQNAQASAQTAQDAAEVAVNASKDIPDLVNQAQQSASDAAGSAKDASDAASTVKGDAAQAASSAATANQAAMDTHGQVERAEAAADRAEQIVLDLKEAPLGTVVMFIKTPPPGYLALNGQSYSKDEYPDFYAYYGSETLPDWTDKTPKMIGTDLALLQEKGWQIADHTHTSGSLTTNPDQHSHNRGTMNITGAFGQKQVEFTSSGAFYDAGDWGENSSGAGNAGQLCGFDASRSWTGDTSAYTHSHNISGNTGKVDSNGVPTGNSVEVDRVGIIYAIKVAGKLSDEGLMEVDVLKKSVADLTAKLNKETLLRTPIEWDVSANISTTDQELFGTVQLYGLIKSHPGWESDADVGGLWQITVQTNPSTVGQWYDLKVSFPVILSSRTVNDHTSTSINIPYSIFYHDLPESATPVITAKYQAASTGTGSNGAVYYMKMVDVGAMTDVPATFRMQAARVCDILFT